MCSLPAALVMWVTVTVAGLPAAMADAPSVAAPTADARQLIVVTSVDWDANQATLRRFSRSHGKAWVATGKPAKVSLGATGMAWGVGLHRDTGTGPVKKEGDGRSPAGVFRLLGAHGYANEAQSGSAWPYASLDPSDRCIDDPTSPLYNRFAREGKDEKRWSSAEVMRRSDELYRWLVVVDHNGFGGQGSAKAGRGSCIFLHLWRRPGSPTTGCTAMSSSTMAELLAWLDPDAAPALVVLPKAVYLERIKRWDLPALD